MRLSDYCLIDGINVIKDGQFDVLTKIGDTSVNSLVFVEDECPLDIVSISRDRISCIITTERQLKHFEEWDIGIAVHDNPRLCFIRINDLQSRDVLFSNASQISDSSCISPNAYVSNTGVIIGDNVVIEENVKIHSGVIIGNDTVIRFGSVIGSEEFERCFDNEGSFIQAKHNGVLQIGSNVNIEEYVIIDRPLFNWDKTIVGDGSYLGKKSFIGHGCKLGDKCIIAPAAFLCGNSVLGKRCKIGVGAIVSNRLRLGDDVCVSIGSVVNRNVDSKTRVTGYLAVEHSKYINFFKETMMPYL